MTCAWGRYIVAAWWDSDGLHVAVFDCALGRTVTEAIVGMGSPEDDEVDVPVIVSVLQAGQSNSKGPALWFLLAVGCANGRVVLVRPSLVSAVPREAAQWVPLEALLAPNHSSLLVVVSSLAVFPSAVTAFAYHDHLLAMGFERGDIVLRRLRLQNGYVSHYCTVLPGDNQAAVSHLCFPARDRLVVGRSTAAVIGASTGSAKRAESAVAGGATDRLHLVLLSEMADNTIRASEDEARMRVAAQGQQLLSVSASSQTGLVTYAVHERATGAVYMHAERASFQFPAPVALVAAGKGVSTRLAAFMLDVHSDLSVTMRLLGEGGVLVSVERMGPAARIICEAVAARRAALELPLSQALLTQAVQAGLAQRVGTTADECAEEMMRLCVEHGGLAVLQDALSASDSQTARSLHVRNWTERYAQLALAVADEMVVTHWVSAGAAADTEQNAATLARMELTWARLGSLYRLQESLAIASRGASEEARLASERDAALTQAHAQRLEMAAWLLEAGLPLLNAQQFPVAVLDSTCRARREALARVQQFATGREYLFADHLWHAMNAGVFAPPDGSFLWPPESFRAAVDAMLRVPGNVPVPLPIKHAVLLYALLDAAALGSSRDEVERRAGFFSQHMCVAADVERRTRAFWMIDRNVDVERAADDLASVGLGSSLACVGGHSFGVLAVARLLYAKKPAAALTVLQRMGDPQAAADIDVYVATYLANALFHEAVLLCRRMLEAYSTAPLLRLFARCDRDGLLGTLLGLPLNAAEETVLFSFVGAVASESAQRDNRDKLVVYLLMRSRVTEATELWARVRPAILAARPSDAAAVDRMVAASNAPPPFLAGNALSAVSAQVRSAHLF